MSCYLKVYGRLRPSATGNAAPALAVIDKSTVKVDSDRKNDKLFQLHRIFDKDASQDEVFNTVAKSLVEECTEGINGTIFAYGQTGSGKTHTMLGPSDAWSNPVHKGLVPRSIEHLFDTLEKKAQECQKFNFTVNVEFVELYNEDIFDLLSNTPSKIQLRDTGNEINLVGAKSERIDNSLDMMNVVNRGWQSRRTASTAMNRDSSRSHALIIIAINTVEFRGGMKTSRKSILNLVDLAGSERQSHTKASGDRLKEASNINSSLSVLGRCIRTLSSPNAQAAFIPYRESHLTHILKNSLGGNSKTAVIVNMHPDCSFVSESLSTLQFAEACTHIKNKVLRNEVMSGDQEESYKKAIQELRLEIEQTRENTKNEFSGHLKCAEEENKRLQTEIAELKSRNGELGTKYNVALVKFVANSNSGDLPDHIKQLLSDRKSESEISAKCRTLALELAANEKLREDLQEQVMEYRERVQESQNCTLPMLTPHGKRRQSSRNLRRETIYKPSPMRLAQSTVPENDDDHDLLQVQQEFETLKADLEKANRHVVKLTEEKGALEMQMAKELESSKRTIAELNKALSSAEKENQLLTGQVERAFGDLASTLEGLKQANSQRAAAADREKETEKYYSQKVADLESQLSAMKTQCHSLEDQIKAKTALVNQLENTISEQASDIKQLKKTLGDFTAELSKASLLESRVEELIMEVECYKVRESQLKTAIDELHKSHKRDMDCQKSEATAKLNHVEKSLALAKKEWEKESQQSKRLKADAIAKSEAELEELRRSYEEKLNDRVAAEVQVIRNDLTSEQRRTEIAHEAQLAALQMRITSLEKSHKEDSDTISSHLLTTNKERKLVYYQKLREENAQLKADMSKLTEEVDKLRRGVSGTAPSHRVLRSRNNGGV